MLLLWYGAIIFPSQRAYASTTFALVTRNASAQTALTSASDSLRAVTSALIMSNPEWFKYDWVWDKKNSSGYLNAKKLPMRRHEEIVVFCHSSPRYYPIMRKGVLRIKGGMKTPSQVWGKHHSVKSYNDDYYPTSIIEISNANRSEPVVMPSSHC